MPTLIPALSIASKHLKEDDLNSVALPFATPREHFELHHGERQLDKYYWLRDKQDPAVMAYLTAENSYTNAVTRPLAGFSQQLYDEMLARIKETDASVPVLRGNYLYYSRTVEGKQYPIQCRRRGEEEPEQVVLDLNELASGRPFVSIGVSAVSDNGDLLAYTIDFEGFRQYTLQVKDLRNGHVFEDAIPRVTSVAWAADNATLLVTTEDEVTKRSNLLLRHKIGAETAPLYEEQDELFDVEVGRTRDKRFLLLTINSKDTSEVRFLEAHRPDEPLEIFLPRAKGHRYYLDHRENVFFIRTNRGGRAKDFQIDTATLTSRLPEHWQNFVPHRPGSLIEDLDLFQTFAAITLKKDALDEIRFFIFETGQWSLLAFDEPVFVVHPGQTPEFTSTTFRYTYESFLTPSTVYDYDVHRQSSQLLKRQEVLGDFQPTEYQSERLWVQARDGVQIPISIVYKKDFSRDSSRPLLLYGYGSYGISIGATFSSNRFSLLNRGMAYAIAHIRGGSELGEQWREDGMLMKKQNTFNDFVDCAQWLVDSGWTSPLKLAIEGGSAGGLLMGVVVNLRPDLFGAVHMAVPFVDVMNTMMDATLPLTVGEYLEWGNPNEKAAYQYMRSYSPYDNLKIGDYPPILITTSLNDSQVMYWEPAKYVARLRTLKTDRNQLLLKTKMEPAGHGGASGRYDRLRDTAFEYAWIMNQVGVTQ